jgi:hypothetical protein
MIFFFFSPSSRNSPILQKKKKDLEKKIHWIPDGKKKDTSSAEYVTLQKYFSRTSLVIYFFCNPTRKTETGTANRWGGGGTTRVIANHLDQSL